MGAGNGGELFLPFIVHSEDLSRSGVGTVYGNVNRLNRMVDSEAGVMKTRINILLLRH